MEEVGDLNAARSSGLQSEILHWDDGRGVALTVRSVVEVAPGDKGCWRTPWVAGCRPLSLVSTRCKARGFPAFLRPICPPESVANANDQGKKKTGQE